MEAENNIGALYAYDIDKQGNALRLDPDNMGNVSAGRAYRWVHLDLDHPQTAIWIAKQTDPIVSEALTLDDIRPRCVKHGEGILLNLRGVNLNPHSDPEDMVSIRIWVSDNLVISVRRRKLMSIVNLREALERNEAPHTVGGFITKLVDGLTERMITVIEELSDKVDEFEETSLEKPEMRNTELVSLRRFTIHLRRYIGPQREALGKLGGEGQALFSELDQRNLRETHDQITRIVEELDAIRERSGILNEQVISIRAEEMNRNMLILSVVAAVFLPLGFLTGLLGVNISGIPGAENPYAFLMFCILLLAISVGLLWWFRKRNWI